jgi:hypothetical protein
MDLITHIPGITNSGSFTPGANTPAPFNASHTGAVNGAGPSTATKNMAEIFNRMALSDAALITMLGGSIDNANWVQGPELLLAALNAINTNAGALNTNINTVSTGLAAELVARAAGDVKQRCSLRRTNAQNISAGVTQFVGWTDVAGQAWNSGANIVIPAGVPAATPFEVRGMLSVTRANTSPVVVLIKINGVALAGVPLPTVPTIGFSVSWDFVVGLTTGDTVAVEVTNSTGAVMTIDSPSTLIVEKFA